METQTISEKDEKILIELTIDSFSRNQLRLLIILYSFLKIACSLIFAYLSSLLIFISYFVFLSFQLKFSLFIGIIFLVSHFIFFELYIKRKHNKSMNSDYLFISTAVWILKNRLDQKLYN